MTGVEAWAKMLTEGAKIRHSDLFKDKEYIRLSNGEIVNREGKAVCGFTIYINEPGWELYTEPTVTLAEAVACVMDGGTARNTVEDMGVYLRLIDRHVVCRYVDFRTNILDWPAQGWFITKRSDRT